MGWLFVALGLVAGPADGAVWKASGQIGFTDFYAEMNDEKDPVMVQLRIENRSQVSSLRVSRYFVQLTNAENNRMRPVTADEMASDYLQRLRILLPRHAREIDQSLSDIQADFPQEKIVEVYGRLKKYMRQGRPIKWRCQLENWLLGKPPSKLQEIQEAEGLIEKIGRLAENYFWPTQIAPNTVYTGLVFFERPARQPARVYFQMGEDFLGRTMSLAAGDKPGQESGVK